MINLLNRKAITKSILFKYLNHRKVSVTLDFSKQILIEKVVQYWSETYKYPEDEVQGSNNDKPNVNTESINKENISTEYTENFPVHLMARQFGNWFFDEYNQSNLNANDFWPDVACEIDLISMSEIQQQSTTTAQNVLELLTSLKLKYEFFFNPNVCHSGIQGRIDPHGMVLVLCCGTLHIQQQGFIGVFECAFGLIRDPFTDNNWKIKHMRLRLKSSLNAQNEIPSLEECESLQMMLALPETSDAL